MCFGLLLYVTAFSTAWALGGLQVYPTRIVMEGRLRSVAINLTNTDATAAGYRIEMVDAIYEDDGSLTLTDDSLPVGFPSARSMIRFSPRQVRLAPGESQTVRVIVRRDALLPVGEYRVHARFVHLSNDLDDASHPHDSDSLGKAASVTVGMDVSVAIPIIIRQGDTSAVGNIQSAVVTSNKNGEAILDLKLGRVGNRSLFVDLVLSDASNKEIARLDGLALPVPNPWRRVLFAIPKITSQQLESGGYQLKLLDHDSGAVLDHKRM